MITSLQIGSGKPEGMYRERHWVNVDVVRPKPRGHFVQASALTLPFPRRRFKLVHAIHVLEHVPRKEKVPGTNYYVGHVEFLREVARVLTACGSAFIEVPDYIECARLMVQAADAGDHEGARIRIVGTYGKGRTVGDFHEWGFTQLYLEQLFAHVGLKSERSGEMISGHHKQEPVLLMRAWHG